MAPKLFFPCTLLAFILLSEAPSTFSQLQGSEGGLLGVVPVKDTFAFGGNNLRFDPVDFSRRERRVRIRRPGTGDVDDISPEYSESESEESDEGRHCGRRPSRGSCRGKSRRWYYSSKIDECLPFRGCARDGNSFSSYNTCADYCMGSGSEEY